MTHVLEHTRPALTVDCVVFGFEDGGLQMLLCERDEAPHRGCWELPGAFVQMDETLDDAAERALREEAGIGEVFLEQLYSFGAIDRDPRGRVVTVAYYGLVPRSEKNSAVGTESRAANWHPARHPPELAFDHRSIVEMAIERLQAKLRSTPIGFELLPETFTLTQLQSLYESVLERELDKRNFRKKIMSFGVLIGTGEFEKNVSRRAAQLYRFDREKYRQLARDGFQFGI